MVYGMVQAGWVAPHMGLALSSSLAAYLNAGLLYRGVRKDQSYRPAAGWGRYSLRVIGASIVLAIVLASLPAELVAIEQSIGERVMGLSLLLAAAAAGWFGALLLGGWRPRELLRHSP